MELTINWTAIGTLAQIVSTLAVVLSVIYLARQVEVANRLARAEASRTPNSDLNSLNASFGTDPVFRMAMQQLVNGASRAEVEATLRMAADFYLISITNLQEQLVREIKAGALSADAQDFGGAGLFSLPYFKTSWVLYRRYFSSGAVGQFEKQFNLGPTLVASW